MPYLESHQPSYRAHAPSLQTMSKRHGVPISEEPIEFGLYFLALKLQNVISFGGLRIFDPMTRVFPPGPKFFFGSRFALAMKPRRLSRLGLTGPPPLHTFYFWTLGSKV